VTWATIRKAYETVAGQLSSKSGAKKKRGDRNNLVKLGWMTSQEAESLFKTASFYVHGYPRDALGKQIEYEDARRIVFSLFWRLVDKLQPI
jgi:hypothetical protein